MNGMFHNKKFSDIKDAFNSVIYPSNVYQNYKWIFMHCIMTNMQMT